MVMYLIACPCVDIFVRDVRDVSVDSKRSHRTSTRPIAVNVLDQDVLCWRFDCYALIL